MMAGKRRGLSLVEVVALSGMGLVLVAVQIPAVQRAREAARRSQCVNNLKQVGLAMHNYASVNDSLPMSNVIGSGHGNGHAALTTMLPYMEQSPIYNAYNFHLENWQAANNTATRVRVASFICPSNPKMDDTPASEIRTHHDKPYPGKSVFAPSSYGANWGGVRQASGDAAFKAYPGSHLGTILPVVDPDAKAPTTNVKFKDVTDGLSFTVAFVEKPSSFGWAVGGWGGSEFDVNMTPVYTGSDPKLRRVFTGSYHPDGTNAAFCDGSVKFIKADLDRKIWYALTTRAGGEAVKY